MAFGTAAAGLRESASSSIRRFFEMAADHCNLHPEMRRLLSVPFRELTVELPLRRDDERLQLFRGYRVQHNGVRGPVLGSVDFQANVDAELLRARAESMTWRCAVASVPFGGAAGAIACEAGQFSPSELERLARRYTNRVHHVLGIYHDVCMPSVNTLSPECGQAVIAWMAQEFATLQKGAMPPVIGRSAELGGIPEIHESIGNTIAALAAQAWKDVTGSSNTGARVGIRSFDQSGLATAMALVREGFRIVLLSEARGAVRCSTGIDLKGLCKHIARTGSFEDFAGTGYEDELHAADCDLLLLGAPECSLTAPMSSRVRARVVLETSPLAITPDAETSLNNRGVTVIPDLVAAIAPVLAANAEWSSMVQHSKIDSQKVAQEIESAMLRSYTQVRERAQRDRVSMRLASYAIAVERVARCERLRIA